MKLSLAAFALATCTSGLALAQPLTTVSQVPIGAGAWKVRDVRTGGVVRVSDARPDAFGGRGSLELILPGPGDTSFRAEAELFSPDTVLEPGRGLVPTAGGFGALTELRDLLVTWYRDGASTTWPWVGPAVRVFVYDPDLGVNGTSSIMVWEPIYAGYATGPNREVPVDQWVASAIHDDRFWRQPLYLDGQRVPVSFCADNPSECYRYVRLEQWGFGPRAVIFGLTVAVGGGWPGSFTGYVDHLSLELTNGRTWTWDFEPAGSPPVCEEDRHDRRARRRARRAERRSERRAERRARR